MTPLLHEFAKIVLAHNNKDYQLAMLGDCRQCIYKFKHSDSRFLSMCDVIFNNDKIWREFTMDQSFRITAPMADAVRALTKGESTIFSNKKGPKP